MTKHIKYAAADIGILSKGINRARRRGRDWFVVVLSNGERGEFETGQAEHLVEYLQTVFKNKEKA